MEQTLPLKFGRYRLDVLLGRGGMADVHKARDERLRRWVAIKHLHSDAAGDPEGRRALREARTAAQLGHPAIIRVFDVLEDDGDVWIVMELVDGPNLAELLRDGPLDVGLAVDYGRQVASGLAAAHAAGIVHRDLKTENVMVPPSGHVKILDFGLARQISPPPQVGEGDESTISLPGRIVGTPRAMSPEQARGLEVDARSDLFSFGVLLYEMLTGLSPFRGRSLYEILHRVTTHRQPPVRQLNPRVPQPLSDLVDQLLEKDPALRREGAGAVAEALEGIAAASPVTSVATRFATADLAENETLPDSAPLEDAVVKTLLLSDLVESTKLVEELGDREAAALFRSHERLARDLLVTHGGREIDKTDGFLLLFDRPWNAVCYALAYHEEIRQLAAETGTVLAARVGIHLGEVILHRNPPADVARGAKPLEVEGLAKPTAARLTSLAGPGHTLLTRTAYEVARRASVGEAPAGLQWLEHGRYRFRGLAEDVEVFEVGVPGVAPLRAPVGSEKVRPVATVEVATDVGDDVATELRQPVVLRSWPSPELPKQPYPVLLPYTHPALLGGRDRDLDELRVQLRTPVPILGLSAPSGAGKTSLLRAGLVPALRAEGKPVALVRHPHEAGVVGRLLGDLLEGGEPLADDDWRGFVERLCEVERLAGEAPLLVLDQFEDVLRRAYAAPTRAGLGVLLAATVRRRPGRPAPACRWLLAYRREYHGEVAAWLGDVLAEARAQELAGIDGLPHDLASPDRFHPQALAPLGSPLAGADPVTVAAAGFLAAIEAPSALRAADGSPQYPWRFAAGSAERLARTFAEARVARPEAPLTPELQVVLAHLMARAGERFVIEVPEDPGDLIAEALADHLGRALEAAFPASGHSSGEADFRTRRSRALLALRELATAAGLRDESLPATELARAIGEDGEKILERLATPLTRLVVPQVAPGGWRYVLSHDRMAEVVVGMVEEGQHGTLLVDAELLRLRRLVALGTALHSSGEEPAPRIPRRHFRRIASHAEALLWDEERRAWWAACQRRRRADRRRRVGWATIAVVMLVLLAVAVGTWSRQRAEYRALLAQVAGGEPAAAFDALDRLAVEPDADRTALLVELRRRQVAMDVLERGLLGVAEEKRSAAVLRAVEIALPWTVETPGDAVLIANLVWVLDFVPGRDPTFAERARSLRDRVLEPLRRQRPPPVIPEGDPDWIEIPGGTFLMGTGAEQPGDENERPQHEVTISAFRLLRHEVTNVEYRRLVPDRKDAEELPAGYLSWYEAYTYAAWLGGRLPTEAEWEYAARAGCAFPYCDREGRETTLDAVAWTRNNSLNRETGEVGPQPVMLLESNPWGLYDMLGNLSEWTADWFGEYSTAPQTAPWGPVGPPPNGQRVNRGRSFGVTAEGVRVTKRPSTIPRATFGARGFRVLLPDVLERLTVDH